jgi:hypothetical protein
MIGFDMVMQAYSGQESEEKFAVEIWGKVLSLLRKETISSSSSGDFQAWMPQSWFYKLKY